jgi:hypothetical protein
MKKSYKFLIGLLIVGAVAVTYRAPVVDAAILAIKQLKIDLSNGRIPVASTSTTLASGKVMIGDSAGVAAEQTLSGDVTVNNSGTTFLSTSSIVNADINGSAGILFSKFENLSTAKILIGSGAKVATEQSVSGDVTMNSAGAVTISAGAVETARLESGLQPSHVTKFSGEVTWSGGGTTLKTGVFGSFTTDIIVASINTVPSEAAYLAAADVFKNNSTIFTLSAANTSNDAVIAYTINRAAP